MRRDRDTLTLWRAERRRVIEPGWIGQSRNPPFGHLNMMVAWKWALESEMKIDSNFRLDVL